MISIVKGPLRDSELFAPFVEVFLNTTKRHFYSAFSVFGLIARRGPNAVSGHIAAVVIFTLQAQAVPISREHVVVEVGEGHPSLAHRDATATIARVVLVGGVGAASDHREPYSDDRVSIFPGKAKQLAGDEAAGGGVLHLVTPVRDDGRYANNPLRQWFDSLKSKKGPCCSDADGAALADPDWESIGGHYRVKLNGVWYDVPEDAVITEKNRAGVAMVWPMTDGVTIRCFLPGPLA